jgi:nucleoside-diphosphate-sugar epimerase
MACSRTNGARNTVASFLGNEWFVTGANGYLGRELCNALKKKRYRVTGCLRATPAPSMLTSIGIQTCCYSAMEDEIMSSSVFVHCAGKTAGTRQWDEYKKINADWSCELADIAIRRHCACFIYISSIAAMGYQNRPDPVCLDENSAPQLMGGEMYGRSKKLAEDMLLSMFANTETKLVILRPGLVYGHRPLVSPQTYFRRGLVIDSAQRVPLVHIENFIDAVIGVANAPGAEGVFLVVDSEQPTLKELNLSLVESGLLRYHPWKVGKMGFWLAILLRGIVRLSRGDRLGSVRLSAQAEFVFKTRRLSYCTKKLRSRTGWKQRVSLKDGLRTTKVMPSESDQ